MTKVSPITPNIAPKAKPKISSKAASKAASNSKAKGAILPKIAGGLAIVSALHDIHKTALIYSNKSYNKAISDNKISRSIRYQKADRISYKDSQRKNFLAQGDFSAPFIEIGARVGGYIAGALKTSLRYIPNFVCATIALVAKSPKVANISAVLLGCCEAFDFARYGLGIGQRDDYLE